MKKYIVYYNESSGSIEDRTGAYLGVFSTALEEVKEDKGLGKLRIEDAIALKEAGFSQEEITELHKKGTI